MLCAPYIALFMSSGVFTVALNRHAYSHRKKSRNRKKLCRYLNAYNVVLYKIGDGAMKCSFLVLKHFFAAFHLLFLFNVFPSLFLLPLRFFSTSYCCSLFLLEKTYKMPINTENASWILMSLCSVQFYVSYQSV